MTPKQGDILKHALGLDELLAGRRTMNLETHILLRCYDCKREMEVQRDEHDYQEAVRVEVRCDECDDGDFAEVFQYDAAGKHITRDPSLPPNVELTGDPGTPGASGRAPC